MLNRIVIGVLALIALGSQTFAVVSATGGAQSAQVRINARPLADGRIEFALQQRQADGTWGERILPRARKLPANATVDRWLSSSEISVSRPPSIVQMPVLTNGPEWWQEHRSHITYSAIDWDNDLGNTFTRLNVRAQHSDSRRITGADLYFGCAEGQDWESDPVHGASFGGSFSIEGTNINPEDGIGIYAEGQSGDEHNGYVTISDSWHLTTESSNFSGYWDFGSDANTLMTELSRYDDVVFVFYDSSGRLTTVGFDIDGAFETPIQPNLTHCGEY